MYVMLFFIDSFNIKGTYVARLMVPLIFIDPAMSLVSPKMLPKIVLFPDAEL